MDDALALRNGQAPNSVAFEIDFNSTDLEYRH
jgi:hypothetical protein